MALADHLNADEIETALRTLAEQHSEGGDADLSARQKQVTAIVHDLWREAEGLDDDDDDDHPAPPEVHTGPEPRLLLDLLVERAAALVDDPEVTHSNSEYVRGMVELIKDSVPWPADVDLGGDEARGEIMRRITRALDGQEQHEGGALPVESADGNRSWAVFEVDGDATRDWIERDDDWAVEHGFEATYTDDDAARDASVATGRAVAWGRPAGHNHDHPYLVRPTPVQTGPAYPGGIATEIEDILTDLRSDKGDPLADLEALADALRKEDLGVPEAALAKAQPEPFRLVGVYGSPLLSDHGIVAVSEHLDLREKCLHCHLFIDVNETALDEQGQPIPGRALFTHLHRGDELDEALDESHEPEPSGRLATLLTWKTYGPEAMRERFTH